MNYTLMNKNAELMELDIEYGHIRNIVKIHEDMSHLFPVFLQSDKNNKISWKNVQDWWRGRQIPASRQGLKDLLWGLPNHMSVEELVENSLGLSLSDQYWIKPSQDVKWRDVNFFTNSFSEDIGNLLVTGGGFGGSLVSPDNTSDGNIKKCWKIINNTRYLLKGSSNIDREPEPFREVLASKIAEVMMKPFNNGFVSPYHIISGAGKKSMEFYSACPNFITEDTEYVSFNQINNVYKRDNRTSPYTLCKDFYGEYGYVMDIMFLLDYIILNEDRHFGNFGIIRSVLDGSFLMPAPIFDTGSSLFYDTLLINTKYCESKPFNKDFSKNIKNIDLSVYQDSIRCLEKCIENLFIDSFKLSIESEERQTALLRVIKSRINSLGIKNQ